MPSAVCGLWSEIQLIDNSGTGVSITPYMFDFITFHANDKGFISKCKFLPIITDISYISFESAFNNTKEGVYAFE